MDIDYAIRLIDEHFPGWTTMDGKRWEGQIYDPYSGYQTVCLDSENMRKLALALLLLADKLENCDT